MSENDARLIALAAVVDQQTMLMRAENEDRLRNNNAMAYTFGTSGLTPEAEYLRKWVMGE